MTRVPLSKNPELDPEKFMQKAMHSPQIGETIEKIHKRRENVHILLSQYSPAYLLRKELITQEEYNREQFTCYNADISDLMNQAVGM